MLVSQRRVAAAEHTTKEKKRHLQELLLQGVMYSSLTARNKNRTVQPEEKSRMQLPFIFANAKRGAKINIDKAENQREISLNFDCPFDIYDYSEILKGMNMTPERDQVQSLIPQELLHLLPPDIYQSTSHPVTTPSPTANGSGINADTVTGAASLLTTLSALSRKK